MTAERPVDDAEIEDLPALRAGATKDRVRSRAQALFYVQKLTKVYPSTRGFLRKPELLHALGGVSFYVKSHETFGIVGESGSGKSTLARCMLRLVEPTLGRVVFDGIDLMTLPSSELRALRRRIQLVLQNPFASLDPRMTVGSAIAEGIDVFRLAASAGDRREQVTGWCDRVGLAPSVVDRYPHELSGGERQRVAIARALAVRPDFLVLDEPTSALDVSVQAQVLDLLDELRAELDLTRILISHDLRVIRHTSDRMAVMHFGKLVELGPTGEVADRRLHPYTRALFAAMPSRDPGRRALPIVHAAEAPNPLAPPMGCAYFARCPNAIQGRCDVEEPVLSETSPRSRHRIACWNPCDD